MAFIGIIWIIVIFFRLLIALTLIRSIMNMSIFFVVLLGVINLIASLLAIRQMQGKILNPGRVLQIFLLIKAKVYDKPLRHIEMIIRQKIPLTKNILLKIGIVIDNLNTGLGAMHSIIVTFKYIPRVLMTILLIYEVYLGVLENYYKYLFLMMIPIIYDNVLRMISSEIQFKKKKNAFYFNIYDGVNSLKLLETWYLYKGLNTILLLLIGFAWLNIFKQIIVQMIILHIINKTPINFISI
jgi:hypothetical protein